MEADAENENFLENGNSLNHHKNEKLNHSNQTNGSRILIDTTNGEIFHDNFDVKFKSDTTSNETNPQNQSTAQIISKSQQLFTGVDMGSSDPSCLVFHGNKGKKIDSSIQIFIPLFLKILKKLLLLFFNFKNSNTFLITCQIINVMKILITTITKMKSSIYINIETKASQKKRHLPWKKFISIHWMKKT